MSTTSPSVIEVSPAIVASPARDPASADSSLEAVFPLRRFSVGEYEQIGRAGILTEDDAVELLDGLIVVKMSKHPPHDALIDLLSQLLHRQLPLGWYPRSQNVLLTSDSAPEPDIAVVRGEPQHFLHRHPTAEDVALIVEVADSSLLRDRHKRKIYARAGVEQYWIVDLTSQQIEMYAAPDRPSAEFRRTQVVALASSVAFTLPSGVAVTLPLDTALATSAS